MSTIPGNNVTLTAAQIVGSTSSLIVRTPTANSNDTLDTASNIILTFYGLNDSTYDGDSFYLEIYNDSLFSITLNPGTGITMYPTSVDLILPQIVRTYIFIKTSGSTLNMYLTSSAVAYNQTGTTLAQNNIFVGNSSNIATAVPMSGDATINSSGALTLATVNGSPASTTLSSITTNAKGLVTTNTTGNLTGDVTSTGLTTTYNNIVPLTKGGTNANLVASNGGIFYSTATAGAILSGTAAARRMLQSGATAAPTWSTATWPATTTINRLLYSSAANTVAEVTTANSAALVTSSAGVPTYSATMTNGQVIIGSTGATPVAATLTAGSGISITNGAGSITVANSVPLFRAFGPSATITPGSFPVAYTTLTTYNAPTFDSGTYSYATGVVTILVAGVYEVCFTLQFNSNGTAGSSSGSFQGRILQNGSSVNGSVTQCNMPKITGTNNRTHCTKAWIITAAANDTVAIQYAETTTNTRFQVTQNESVFTIKRLQ